MRKCVFVFALLTFLVGCKGWAYETPTVSMIPTIKVGDRYTVNKFAYLADSIERFDIVVYNSPEAVNQRTGQKSGTVFCKRVIGLPGEKIEIKKGQVFINDNLLNESFEKISDKYDFAPMIIPQDEYFMMGDNRPDSLDSRFKEHSTIKRKDILGKVMNIYPNPWK